MRQKGFTMIEVLMVLTIAGILLTVSTLEFNKWTMKYGIEREIKQIYTDLMEARIRAMGSNRYRFVTFGTNSGAAANYAVYDDSDGNGPPLNASDTLVSQQSLQNNVTLTPAGTTQVSFDQQGLASANTTIFLTNNVGAAYDCISVTQTRVGMGKMNGGNCVQE
jgi:type IV fimbrial biogenesis protein FimT